MHICIYVWYSLILISIQGLYINKYILGLFNNKCRRFCVYIYNYTVSYSFRLLYHHQFIFNKIIQQQLLIIQNMGTIECCDTSKVDNRYEFTQQYNRPIFKPVISQEASTNQIKTSSQPLQATQSPVIKNNNQITESSHHHSEFQQPKISGVEEVKEVEMPTHIVTIPAVSQLVASLREILQKNNPIKYYESIFAMPVQINGMIYHGELNGKIPEGFGKVYMKSGAFFEGYFRNGKANGFGRYIYADGSYYEGDIVNNTAQGNGKFDSGQGYSYQGSWKHDKPNGRGTEKHISGDVYKGEFLQGKKYGNGIYLSHNRTHYEGTFSNDQFNGHGKIKYPDGREYDGEWFLGKFHGKGKFSWQEGKKYDGQYINGLRDGYGIYSWSNGKTYQGNWSKGKQHGKGLIKINGMVTEGIWRQGEKIA